MANTDEFEGETMSHQIDGTKEQIQELENWRERKWIDYCRQTRATGTKVLQSNLSGLWRVQYNDENYYCGRLVRTALKRYNNIYIPD